MNEADRLAALQSYGILDTDFEESFDRITRLAANLFDTPISLVTLVDEKRQWFKSVVGFDIRETSRDVAFCSHAIRGNDVFVVADAERDERFCTNPLVTGDPKIRFYAGAPLNTREGFSLGTICVIDRVAREPLDAERVQALQDFSGLVVELLETRRIGRRAHLILTSVEDSVAGISSAAADIRLAGLHVSQMDEDDFVAMIRGRSRTLAERIKELKETLAALTSA